MISRRAAWHAGFGLVAPLAVMWANLRPTWSFTVEDAFLGFRYARNFARGLGLVYNPGERVEGYTSLTWELLLAGALKLGLDPERVTKWIGALAASGALILIWRLSSRLRPFATAPCLATWLFATAVPTCAFAPSGMETMLFVLLLLAAVALAERPASGALFALATLTRPEGAIAFALLGTRDRKPLRYVSFALPLVAQVAWRHHYYGHFLSQTFWNRGATLRPALGAHYVGTFLWWELPTLALAIAGVVIAWRARSRLALSGAAFAIVLCAYVTASGGDWMPGWRYLAPATPFLFLLADLATRTLAERNRASLIAVAAFAVAAGGLRAIRLRGAQRALAAEELFWDRRARPAAEWFLTQPPGSIVSGDYGRLGWVTDAPIIGLGGLVDPEFSWPVHMDRVYRRTPRYLVVVADAQCLHAIDRTFKDLFSDGEFAHYALAHKINESSASAWCIFARRP
jgi:hypothetical protein